MNSHEALWQFATGFAAWRWPAFKRLRRQRAAEFTMKFGTATFNETQHQYIKFFKEAVEKASNGRIEVGIFRAASSGRSRA